MLHLFKKSVPFLFILFTFTTVFAQNDFRRWQPEDGVAVRQGWHVEWFRSGIGRTEGELAGEVAFVWTDCRNNGYRDVYMQVIDTNGEFKFDENGLRVTSYPSRQEDPVIYPSIDGGWFIGWVDFRADTLGDIHCTKIDAEGNNLWGSDDDPGISVSSVAPAIQSSIHIVEDNDGGCILAWLDQREGNTDIYAMHITSNGERNPDWAENGISVCRERGRQDQIDAISDGEGGMIIVWNDGRDERQTDIWTQRISSDAEFLWGNGVITCNNEAHQEQPKLCPDGANGAFITWVDHRTYDETNKDIYAQHINNEGQLLWGEDGSAVCVEEREQRSVQITASGEAKAIICWEDGRNEDWEFDIYTMRISGDDEMVMEWEQDSGVPVVIAENDQKGVRLCPDGSGGAYYVWEDTRENDFPEVDIWAQRIDSVGTGVWEENGIPICTALNWQDYPVILSSGNSSTIAWRNWRGGNGGLNTQRVTGEGEFVWEENGLLLVDDLYGNAFNHKLLSRGNGEFVLLWSDGRLGALGSFPFIQYCRDNGDEVEMLLQKDGQQVFGGTVGGCNYPDATLSEDGSIFIVWQDHRINQVYSIYAQKLSEAGELLWGESGIIVSRENNHFDVKNPMVCSDDNGGIYVVWNSETEEAYYELFMQHIDADGNRLWEEDIRLTNREMDDEVEGIIPDGEGGAVLVWEARGNERNDDIWAARINPDGEHIWGDGNNGLIVCNAQHQQRNPQLIRHQNGYVVVWTDDRADQDRNQRDVFAQFINYDGSLRWRENGAAICTEEYNQYYPSIAIDNQTNIWVAWADDRNINQANRRDLYFQKFSSRATDSYRPIKLLDDSDVGGDGLPLCNAENDQWKPYIIHDAQNGMWITWEDLRNSPYSDIYATHLNSDGVPFDGWGENGQVVCDAHHRQESPESVLLRNSGETGIVTVWIDKRSTGIEELFNIYTQRLDDDYVSVNRQPAKNKPTGYTLSEPYPSPFNSQTRISYSAKSDGHVRIGLYDITGRLVRQLSSGKITAGNHHLSIKADDLSAGQYIVRLEAEDVKLERRIVLVK
ncbi:MAG: T9SS type A sorting domain-containing protein [Calditrichaeota bacterium]|nr:T9SS type A sorting domain-containing protein [Calditrichota bacterium]